MTMNNNAEVMFDCITQEAERQKLKHPEHVDAIGAAAKKIQSREGWKTGTELHARGVYESLAKTLGSEGIPENPP